MTVSNRAYSQLDIKSVDDEKRILTGLATTPSVDRMGDVVEPDGAQFNLPIPFLWQHDSASPVGSVTKAKVTAAGIEVEIQLQKTDEPGSVKNRLDAAWQDIKLRLVRGLSIGFAPIETAQIEGSFGLRYLKWLWLELSGVTIAANGDCSIQAIKSIDQAVLAATGQSQGAGDRREPQIAIGESGPELTTLRKGAVSLLPGASGKSQPNPKPQKGPKMSKTIAEQISAFEATRAAKSARMEELMSAAADKGETLDAEQTEEYDGLDAEVKAIDSHLVRLGNMEKAAAARATPVTPAAGATSASAAQIRAEPTVKAQTKSAPGIQFARVVKMIGLAKGSLGDAQRMAEQRYADDPAVINVIKAAVASGSTASGNWAGNLVGDETSVYADFVEYLRPMTVLGKFGTGNIPSLRRVPFRVALIGQTGGGAGYWVGEGKAKPLTAFDFSRTTLEPLKVANIAVLTEEVLRDSSPSAEMIVRDELANALKARLDTDFINPAKTASAGVSPASITNGATAIASTGTDADAVRLDVRALFGAFIAANNAPASGVWIMSATNALALSLMVNALGQPEFNGISMAGGVFFGLPVIVSEYAGTAITLVNANDIYLGDEGGIAVDLSREASLEMSDAPAQSALTGTGASMVSMFQTNAVAIRAERTINWARRRATSVAYLTGVTWGGAVPAS